MAEWQEENSHTMAEDCMASCLQDSPLRPLICEYQSYIDAYNGKTSQERGLHSKEPSQLMNNERLLIARKNRQDIIDLIRTGSNHERSWYNLLQCVETFEKSEEEKVLKQISKAIHKIDAWEEDEGEEGRLLEKTLQANILNTHEHIANLRYSQNNNNCSNQHKDLADIKHDAVNQKEMQNHVPNGKNDATAGFFKEKLEGPVASMSRVRETDKLEKPEQHWLYSKINPDLAQKETSHPKQLHSLPIDKTGLKKDDVKPSLQQAMKNSNPNTGNEYLSQMKVNHDNVTILLQLQKDSIGAFQNILRNNQAMQNAWRISMKQNVQCLENENAKLLKLQQSQHYYKECETLKQDLLDKCIENNKLEHFINQQREKIRKYDNDMSKILAEYEKHYAYCRSLKEQVKSSQQKCEKMEMIIEEQKKQLTLQNDWIRDNENVTKRNLPKSETVRDETSQVKEIVTKEKENEIETIRQDLTMSQKRENEQKERAESLLDNIAELVTEQILDKIAMDFERQAYNAKIERLETEKSELECKLECQESDVEKSPQEHKMEHEKMIRDDGEIVNDKEDYKEEKSTSHDLADIERSEKKYKHNENMKKLEKSHDMVKFNVENNQKDCDQTNGSNIENVSTTDIDADADEFIEIGQNDQLDLNDSTHHVGIGIQPSSMLTRDNDAKEKAHGIEKEMKVLKSEMNKRMEEFEIALEDDNERIELLVNDIESYIIKNKELRGIVCKKQLEIASLTTQIHTLEENAKKLKNKICHLDENIICLEKENAEKQLKIDCDARQFSALLNGTKPVNISDRLLRKSQSYTTFETIECLEERISDYWSTINELKNDNMEYHRRNKKLLEEIDELSEERAQQRKELEDNEINLASYLSEIRRLEKKVQVFEDEYNKIGQTNSEYKEEIEDEHDYIMLIENELEVTKKIKDKLERSYDELEEDIKNVMRKMKLLEAENEANKAKAAKYENQLDENVKSMGKQIAAKDDELEQKQVELQNVISEYKKAAYESKDYQHKIEGFIVSFARYISTQTIDCALFRMQAAENTSSFKEGTLVNEEKRSNGRASDTLEDPHELKAYEENADSDSDFQLMDGHEWKVVSDGICHSFHSAKQHDEGPSHEKPGWKVVSNEICHPFCQHDEIRSHERLMKLSVDLKKALEAKESKLMCLEEANERLAMEFDRVRTEVHLLLKEKDEKIKYLSAEIIDLTNEQKCKDIFLAHLEKETALFLTKTTIQNAAIQYVQQEIYNQETQDEDHGSMLDDKVITEKDPGEQINTQASSYETTQTIEISHMDNCNEENQTTKHSSISKAIETDQDVVSQRAENYSESKNETWSCGKMLEKVRSANNFRRFSNIMRQIKESAEKKDAIIQRQKQEMLELEEKEKRQTKQIDELKDLISKSVCDLQLGRTYIEIKTSDNIETRAFGEQVIKCFEKAELNIEVAADLKYASYDKDGIEKLKEFYDESNSELKGKFILGMTDYQAEDVTSGVEKFDADDVPAMKSICEVKPIKGILKNASCNNESNDVSQPANDENSFPSDDLRSGIFFKDSAGFTYAVVLVDEEDLSSLPPSETMNSQTE